MRALVLLYALSYRNIEEMMEERGLRIDHSTLNGFIANSSIAVKSSNAVFDLRS